MAPSRIVLSPRWPLGRRLAMLLEGARCGKKESLRCVLGLRSVRHGQGAAGHRARRVHMLRCARRLACGWWRAHNARVFFQLRDCTRSWAARSSELSCRVGEIGGSARRAHWAAASKAGFFRWGPLGFTRVDSTRYRAPGRGRASVWLELVSGAPSRESRPLF